MSKYIVKYFDSTLLFFTPFAFLNMGVCRSLESSRKKKHWYSKWKTIDTFEHKEDAIEKLYCNMIIKDTINKRFMM